MDPTLARLYYLSFLICENLFLLNSSVSHSYLHVLALSKILNLNLIREKKVFINAIYKSTVFLLSKAMVTA